MGRNTLKKLLSAKTIKFIPGICLLVNALTGPSIPFTPSLFQNAGWFPTIALFLLFTVIAVISALFIVEAMQAIPGNQHFQGTVEFATLVNFYFGPTMHIAAQVCLYGAIQANAIQSIVLCAQAFDNILVDLFGKTCGIALGVFDSSALVCVSSADLSASPFGDKLMLCTIGLVIVLVLTVPLGIMDLDNNVELQLAWFVISIVIFLQWIVTALMFRSTDTFKENPVDLPIVASGVESLAGTIMLSMAFTFVIPSWVNIKRNDVGIERSLWYSGFITLAMYLIIGLIPALCYAPDESTGGNILITLSVYGIPQLLTKITVYLFPIIMLLPSIPVSCIVSYDNIVQNEIGNRRTSAFLAFFIPWICAVPLQTGDILGEFQNWASLIFVSTANFIVPIIIYLKCEKFREEYNKDRSVLTPKQLRILKLIHLHSKPILQWVDYCSATNDSSASKLAGNRPPKFHPNEELDLGSDTINEILKDDLPNPVAEDDKYLQRQSGIKTAAEWDQYCIENGNHGEGFKDFVQSKVQKPQSAVTPGSTVALEYTNTSTSSINFTKLEETLPDFHKTMTLPVEHEFKGVAFRSLPPWVTRRVRARYVAIFCMALVSIVCIGNFILLIKGMIEGDGNGGDD